MSELSDPDSSRYPTAATAASGAADPGDRQASAQAAPSSRSLDSGSIRVGGVNYLYLAVPHLAPALPEGLTETERDVARLAALGYETREIADARGVSRRTVDNQLASVFRKLGVFSRSELCELAFAGDG